MSIYQLPTISFHKIKGPEMKKLIPGKMPFPGLFLILVFLIGLIGGLSSSYIFYLKLKQEIISAGVPIIHSEKVVEKDYVPQTTQEQKVIDVVKENSPSVVSVVIMKEVPVYEEQYIDLFGDGFFTVPQQKQTGTEKQQVGAGTGFIVSEDGLVLTNKHVVSDDSAEYTVVMSDNKEYPAKVLAKDPVQDLAIIKIQSDTKFKALTLGSSSDIQIGQSVIAIGNALGEFQNTVSVGVISGLGRTVVASGETIGTETLEDIIQTDAAINKGNSGGPLLNLKGEVIGINTAVSSSGQNISFAISIDKAKKDIEQVKGSGKISYPYVGVRYVVINKKYAEDKKLSVDYGALVIKGISSSDPAIISGSPAEKAGLKEGDIILEMGGEKITEDNTLSKIISKYNPYDSVDLKVLRDKEELTIPLVLGEWKQ
ncbi:MAG TPA: trypsin-like peptidase domain-containing protein [Candidatus Pacearchaeota archaeon]|nr:trypsin-like peptidase domain-containing protein [Candidatus Pacearchaeota archaeon]HPR79898.1 trypsin-like peptidase domain-containing protein [Candidatus Pacearchaeota archaeon]